MEVIVILFLIIILIILAFLTFGHTSAENDQQTQKISPKGEASSSQRESSQYATASPFDVSQAKPVSQPKVLQGGAFVIDGDSLVIQKTQIRLFGIDAPELNHPFGTKAKWALVNLCKGQTIKAEITAVDVHGRTVARCYLEDGRDLSAEMVKLGLAIDWKKFSGGKYRALELPDARKKLWLADARQKGRMHVWEKYEAQKAGETSKNSSN